MALLLSWFQAGPARPTHVRRHDLHNFRRRGQHQQQHQLQQQQ